MGVQRVNKQTMSEKKTEASKHFRVFSGGIIYNLVIKTVCVNNVFPVIRQNSEEHFKPDMAIA